MKAPDQEFIIVGRVLSPWGIQGQLKVRTETDFPQRFHPGATVYIDRQPLLIEDARWHRGTLVVKFHHIDRAEDARKLQNKSIEIPQSDVQPLEEGRYYYFQLIGLEVVTERGEKLGQIVEVLALESNDVYVVKGPRGEVLIPAIEDVVKAVDLEKGLMTVHPLEGLLELNRKKSDRPERS